MVKCIFTLLLSLLLPVVSNGETPSKKLRGSISAPMSKRGGSFGNTTTAGQCLACNVAVADVQFKEGYLIEHDEYLMCETDEADEKDGKANQLYSLEDLPADFKEKNKKLLQTGKARICIPKGKASRSDRKIQFSKSATPKLLGEREDNPPGRHRGLMQTFGTHSVLLVVVSSSKTGEHDPNVNATILAGNFFGVGPLAQSASVAAQYRKCSNGNLRLIPYEGTNVQNGVIYVKIPLKIAGTNTLTKIQTALVDATQAAIKVPDLRYGARHILFCLPQGSVIGGTDKWVSFGYTNGVMSFHQYSMCTRLSAPMHEMGHNNGFYHSGLNKDPYGDRSGYMGYAYPQTGHPQMCFSAQKNYLAGWFDDRKISVNPIVNGPWGGTLIPPVDYADAVGILPHAFAVVNVGKLYFQLNSAKKFNNETRANANKVNIVSADVPSNPSTLSWLLASLGAGQSYTYPNFNGKGVALVIKVCSIKFGAIDTAKVTIYLKNGVQKSQCGKI